MKKLLLLSLLLFPLKAKAATQVYIPSTSTFQGNSSVINIASGTVRNLISSTFTTTNFVVNSETATLLNVSKLTVTESTFTRSMVGISTVTNGTINNANFGLVGSTGVWTFSGATFNGTRTDNSTATYTGGNNFRNGMTVSTGPTQTNSFNVGTSSITVGVTGAPAFIFGSQTNDEAPAGYVGEWSTGTYGGTNNGAYANSAQNNQYTAFSTITIPSPGDWMVCGTVQTNLNGATMTRNNMALSLFSGNTITDQLSGKNDIDIPVPTSVSAPGGQLCYRFEFTAASTVYLKAKATFSAGQPQYLGFGWATRRR